MVDMYVLGDRFKRQKKTDSIFLVKTATSEIELLSEAVCFNTLYYSSKKIFSDNCLEKGKRSQAKIFGRVYADTSIRTRIRAFLKQRKNPLAIIAPGSLINHIFRSSRVECSDQGSGLNVATRLIVRFLYPGGERSNDLFS